MQTDALPALIIVAKNLSKREWITEPGRQTTHATPDMSFRMKKHLKCASAINFRQLYKHNYSKTGGG